MMFKIDMTGKRFARLIVVEHSHNLNRATYWKARCDCGADTVVNGAMLRNGHTKSCGCLQRETAAIVTLSRSTHGDARGGVLTLEYRIWSTMIQRCENKNNHKFPDYGARGIRVCDRWRHGDGGRSAFECFLGDMGRKPTPSHSIDRKDNDGNYEPDNCRWATPKEQRANRRKAAA